MRPLAKALVALLFSVALAACGCPEGQKQVRYRGPDGVYQYRCVKGN